MGAFSTLAGVLAAVSIVVTSAGGGGNIYPDGHWERSTELNTDNVDDFVQDNVDAGKTVFIRWIASEG